MTEEKIYGGGILLKSIAILDYLQTADQAPTLTEMTAALDMTKSTMSKLLTSLQVLQIVTKDSDTQRYYIGNKMIAYGQKALDQYNVLTIIKPFIQKISDEIGETVHVGERVGDRVLYIYKRDAKNLVTLRSKVGNTTPIYPSAMGKSILAVDSVDHFEAFLSHAVPERFTDHTIMDKAQYRQVIEQVRKTHLAYDNEEYEEGVVSTAIALVARGKVHASMSISTPTYRMTEEKQQAIEKLLLETKTAIERLL